MSKPSSKTARTALYWGGALLVLGLFFILYTFGQLSPYEPQILLGSALLLALLGLFFLVYMAWRPHQWWSLIPGFLLLSMAAAIYLGTRGNIGGTQLAAVIFLGLALAHLFIFLTDRETRWWAWISAGSFFVLIAALLWGGALTPPLLGTFLFLSMGLVFLLLYLLLPHTVQRWWSLLLGAAFIVAAALVFTVSVGTRSWPARLWPLVLIALGAALIVWGLIRLLSRPQRPIPVSPVPSQPADVPPGAVIPVPEDLPPRPTPQATKDVDQGASSKLQTDSTRSGSDSVTSSPASGEGTTEQT